MTRLDKVHIEGIEVCNFTGLTDEELGMILKWRNHDEIRKWMLNTDPIKLEDHLAFISNLKIASDKSYWLVKRNEKYLGVIYFNDYNDEMDRAEFGLYANPKYLSSGIGFELFYYLLQVAFYHLNLSNLYSQSKVENTSTLILHDFFKIKESKRITKSSGGSQVELSYREIHKSDLEVLPKDLATMRKQLRQFLLGNSI